MTPNPPQGTFRKTALLLDATILPSRLPRVNLRHRGTQHPLALEVAVAVAVVVAVAVRRGPVGLMLNPDTKSSRAKFISN